MCCQRTIRAWPRFGASLVGFQRFAKEAAIVGRVAAARTKVFGKQYTALGHPVSSVIIQVLGANASIRWAGKTAF